METEEIIKFLESQDYEQGSVGHALTLLAENVVAVESKVEFIDDHKHRHQVYTNGKETGLAEGKEYRDQQAKTIRQLSKIITEVYHFVGTGGDADKKLRVVEMMLDQYIEK